MLEIPIGHMEGNYFCDEPTLAELKDQDRIIFRYTNPAGEVALEANPNGSLENIAGICNARTQCTGHDAASGARQRTGTRHDRRREDLPLAGRGDGDEVAVGT